MKSVSFVLLSIACGLVGCESESTMPPSSTDALGDAAVTTDAATDTSGDAATTADATPQPEPQGPCGGSPFVGHHLWLDCENGTLEPVGEDCVARLCGGGLPEDGCAFPVDVRVEGTSVFLGDQRVELRDSLDCATETAFEPERCADINCRLANLGDAYINVYPAGQEQPADGYWLVRDEPFPGKGSAACETLGNAVKAACD